jgi:NitT/TauT family transport system substrate-binding protein
MSKALLVVASLCLTVALGAAGCGDDDAASSAEDGGPTRVKMASLGVASDAAMMLGDKKGFFREEGIDIEFTPVEAGGAAVAPAVLKGEYDVAGGGIDGPLLGVSKGLDLKILAKDGAPVSKGDTPPAGTERGTTGIAVPADSKIRSMEDLAGVTLGAITLTGLQYLCIAGAAEKADVNPDDLKVLEIPPPEMLPALEAGRVQAAALVEPFLTIARQQGFRIIADPCVQAMPGVIQAGFFSSGRWAEQNPEVAERLATALTRSNQYAKEHPDEVRAVIPTYTEISPKVVEEITLTPYETSGKNTLPTIVDRLSRYELIEDEPDVASTLTGRK